MVSALIEDHESAPLNVGDAALVRFATKLTLEPGEMNPTDVDALRAVGFSDVAIHDAVQVTGLFAYYNRIADGLGLADEPDWVEDAESGP